MIELKSYLETFISDPDIVNIVLGLVVLLVAMAILRALGFGIFEKK